METDVINTGDRVSWRDETGIRWFGKSLGRFDDGTGFYRVVCDTRPGQAEVVAARNLTKECG